MARYHIFLKISAGIICASILIIILKRKDFPVLKVFGILNTEQNDAQIEHKVDLNTLNHLQQLTAILDEKLKSIDKVTKVKTLKPTCDTDFKRANSCDNKTCLRTELPENLTARVEQLLMPAKLQISREDRDTIQQMTEYINGTYDIIFLTASSSNHFYESQALIKSLHENVFPKLKNFTFIYYNLGLTPQERQQLIRYCKCQVFDFPFHKFPVFMKTLNCYSWKPVLIKSSLPRANFVFWVDASIRFTNYSLGVSKIIETAQTRGFQILGSFDDSTFRTSRSMYHFFGDEPCAYLTLGQAQATYALFHNEFFVDRLILEPWVACAVAEQCMCPADKELSVYKSHQMAQKYYSGQGPIVYGLCHRFDQSAISLILHKLYQEKYPWLMDLADPLISINRDEGIKYFPEN